MSNNLCSIIIGVKNGEAFIKRAIDSVVNQSYNDWELIVVDDGSTDKTSMIVKSYCNSDSRIRYIHQSHKGISCARNNGIRNSKGKYCVFLDADDSLTYDSIAIRVNDMITYDVGLSWYSHILCDQNGQTSKSISGDDTQENKNVFLNRVKNFEAGVTTGLEYVWDKIFDLNIIKHSKVYFDENMDRFEDRCYILQYLETIKKNVYCSFNSVVHYYVNPNSVSHTRDSLLYEKTTRYFTILYNYLKQEKSHINNDAWEGFYHGYINKIIGIYLNSDEIEKKSLLFKLRNDILFLNGIKSYKTKNKRESMQSFMEILMRIDGVIT